MTFGMSVQLTERETDAVANRVKEPRRIYIVRGSYKNDHYAPLVTCFAANR